MEAETMFFMSVQAVLRHLNLRFLILPQYALGGQENHFYNVADLKAKFGEDTFYRIECNVPLYEVRNPNIIK